MFPQTEPISEKIPRIGLVTKHGIFYFFKKLPSLTSSCIKQE